MSGFRKPFVVLREQPGSFVSGVWTPGARNTTTISASVQPVTLGTDMESLPEGRRLADFRKVFSSSKLLLAEGGDGIQSDMLVVDGYAFEVISAQPYQSGVIPHYKMIIVRGPKFTSQQAWLNGSMSRIPQ